MEKIPIGAAAIFLGVSRRKIWQMVKKNQLQVEKDPLDERKKLIALEQLRPLKLASSNRGGE